jgi:hypothetical protein
MKYLLFLLLNLIALFYVDRAYNKEIDRHYLETKGIMETWCVPAAVLQKAVDNYGKKEK